MGSAQFTHSTASAQPLPSLGTHARCTFSFSTPVQSLEYSHVYSILASVHLHRDREYRYIYSILASVHLYRDREYRYIHIQHLQLQYNCTETGNIDIYTASSASVQLHRDREYRYMYTASSASVDLHRDREYRYIYSIFSFSTSVPSLGILYIHVHSICSFR